MQQEVDGVVQQLRLHVSTYAATPAACLPACLPEFPLAAIFKCGASPCSKSAFQSSPSTIRQIVQQLEVRHSVSHVWDEAKRAVQVCIFRNSLRRALKGISQALERLEGRQAGAGDTVQVCRAITTVVGQIAQSLHRLQQVGLPQATCPPHSHPG